MAATAAATAAGTGRRRVRAAVRYTGAVTAAVVVLAAVPAAYWWQERAPAAAADMVLTAADDLHLREGDPVSAAHRGEPYLATGALDGVSATAYVRFEVPEPPAGFRIGDASLQLRFDDPAPPTLLLFPVVGHRWPAGEAQAAPTLGPPLAVGRPADRAREVSFDLSGALREPGRQVFALRSPPMDGQARVVSEDGGPAGPRLRLHWEAHPAGTPRSGLGAAPTGGDDTDEETPGPGDEAAGGSPSPGPGAGDGPGGDAPAGAAGPQPPSDRAIAVGATVQRDDGEDWAEAYARADAAYGPEVLRVFHPHIPPQFTGTAADAAGRTVHVSVKAHPREVRDGVHDEALAQWFADMPRDRDIYWTFFHEPEDDVADGAFTAAEYRQAWQRAAWIAAQVEHPRLYPTLVLMGWTLEPAAGRDWRDYYPGDDVVSTLAWDVYNFDYRAGEYSDPSVLFDRVVDVSAGEGLPWAVAEFGGRLVDGDESGRQRADWIRANADYLTTLDQPPLFVAWYDARIGDGEEYRLRDEPSRRAWQQFAG